MSHSLILAESMSPFMLPDTSRQSTRSMALPSAGLAAAGLTSSANAGAAGISGAATAARHANSRRARDMGSLLGRELVLVHYSRDCNKSRSGGGLTTR